MSSSRMYSCHRWSLFTVALIQLVVCIVEIMMAGSLIDSAVDEIRKENPESSEESLKVLITVTKGMIIGLGVIAIVFCLFGLLGAYRESVGYTITYAIMALIFTIGSIYEATTQPVMW